VTSGDLLARLVSEARHEAAQRRARIPLAAVEAQAARYQPKDFAAALDGPRLAVIAEMKQRTPSMGVLSTEYDPGRLASAYAEGGAAALSVLTHEAGFGGSLEHVGAARANAVVPILRKDFITDAYQVAEARAAGADAVLLIVAALDRADLADLLATVQAQHLTALVEVHDEREAVTAVEAGASVVGVNHRDLRTFNVDLGLTERLRHVVPADRLLVSESGIKGAADARRMRDAGADAILVGELLMRAADPAACIRELASVP
jgi:indole-3-glycerol phosphate synthase